MAQKRTGTDSLPFKNILSDLMKERQLTVAQIATLAGVSKSVVQNWLTGANPHDLKAVAVLAKSLGIGFSTLLLGEPDAAQSSMTIAELYDRSVLFDGLCEVRITKLSRRDKK